MFNFDYNLKKHNPNWPEILGHPDRILISEAPDPKNKCITKSSKS